MSDSLLVKHPHICKALMRPLLPAGAAAVVFGLLLVFYVGLLVNINQIDGTVSDLKEHPYKVTVATGRVEMLLIELQTLDEQLIDTDLSHTDAVLEKCTQTSESLREPLQTIADSYLRDPIQAQDADRHYDQLSETQAEFERMVDAGSSLEEVSRYYASSVLPNIEDLISRNRIILDGAAESFDHFYELAAEARTHTIAFSSVLMAVVLIALLLFLAILRTKDRQEALLMEGYRQARIDAEDANRAKTRFLSSMSHDIRTPISAVIGLMDIIREHDDDPKRVDECATKASRASRHMLALINDVLDMSRVESGVVPLNPTIFSLGGLIDNLATIIKPQADAKRLTLDVVCKEDASTQVMADEMRLEQVLINLLGNAVKYTPDEGLVRLSIEDTGIRRPIKASPSKDPLLDEVVLDRESVPSYESVLGTSSCAEVGIFRFTVDDTGMGMSREFVARVFEPFVREGAAVARKIEGTGLGMSIARNLVQGMGGTISVESEVGVGSRFSVELPLGIVPGGRDSDDAKGLARVDGVRKASAAAIAGMPVVSRLRDMHAKDDGEIESEHAGFRVLVAEDDPLNAEIAVELFGRIGVDVDHVWDGIEAVAAVSQAPDGCYDALFMDVQMPHMGGIEAARELIDRSQETGRRCPPIIAMTANAYEEDRRIALEAGMDGYVVKPFGVSDLRAALERYVLGFSSEARE